MWKFLCAIYQFSFIHETKLYATDFVPKGIKHGQNASLITNAGVCTGGRVSVSLSKEVFQREKTGA